MERLDAIKRLLTLRVRADEQRVLRDIRQILDDEDPGVVLLQFGLHERELSREAEMATSQKQEATLLTPFVLGAGTGVGG